MKIQIWDGREFDFEFSCGEQDVKKMYMNELHDELRNVIDEREELNDMDERGLVLDEVYGMLTSEIKEREQKPQLNNLLLNAIIDGLDEWLARKGITIPNEERDKQDPEANTNIWGDDYYEVTDMIREVLRQNRIVVEDDWDE